MFFGDAGQYDSTPQLRFHVYYTAKDINAAAGSRSAINDNLVTGAILVMDPYGHDKGIGCDYTQPQANHLHRRKVVVVDVLRDNTSNKRVGVDLLDPAASATQRTPGWVWAEAGNADSKVLCANGVNAGDFIGPAAGSFAAVAKTSVATMAAIHEVLGVANQSNSSGSNAVISCCVPASGIV